MNNLSGSQREKQRQFECLKIFGIVLGCSIQMSRVSNLQRSMKSKLIFFSKLLENVLQGNLWNTFNVSKGTLEKSSMRGNFDSDVIGFQAKKSPILLSEMRSMCPVARFAEKWKKLICFFFGFCATFFRLVFSRVLFTCSED